MRVSLFALASTGQVRMDESANTMNKIWNSTLPVMTLTTSSRRTLGFTLIETVIALGIAAILVTAVSASYGLLTRKNVLEAETGLVSSLLEEARALSISSKKMLMYGLHFSPSTVVAFAGETYNPADPNNRVFAIDGRVIVDATLASEAADVTFDRLTGSASVDGRVDLSLASDASQKRTVWIYKTGIIEVAINLPPPEFDLGITKEGDGSGTVETEGELAILPGSSYMAAANSGGKKFPKTVCGSSCRSDVRKFIKKSSVTLLATPDSGSLFEGWSGSCSGSSPTCNLTIRRNEQVTATFSKLPVLYELRIVKTGDSKGKITSSEAGISCGKTCLDVKYTYLEGSSVILSADPAANSKITWGGQCLSAGSNPTCTVNMDSDKTVFANFSKVPQRTLRVKVDNFTRNAGFLKRTPGTTYSFGLRTQSTTEASYPEGTKVVLMRYPSKATEEINWSGACSGSSNTCEVTMDADKYVVLRLNDAPPRNLSIYVGYFNGSSGALYTSPWGVYYYGPNNVNKTSGSFEPGTKVQLISDSYGTSRVMFWGGACSGSGSACEVTMNQDQFVMLFFTK